MTPFSLLLETKGTGERCRSEPVLCCKTRIP